MLNFQIHTISILCTQFLCLISIMKHYFLTDKIVKQINLLITKILIKITNYNVNITTVNNNIKYK